MRGVPPEYLIPDPKWELPSIAISLAQTGRFADPYLIPTGPTAHLPPIIPYIYSLIYRWFGLTSTAGFVSYLFLILTGAALYALLPWFADQLGLGRTAGFAGGLAGALTLGWYGHGEYLAGILLGLILVQFLRRWGEEDPSWWNAAALGGLIGFTFHVQPAVLTVVLGCTLFEIWWKRKPRRYLNLGVMILTVIAVCIPWTWRNYQVFDEFVFIRSNFGLELRMGNHDGVVPTMDVLETIEEHRHPAVHFTETRKVRDLGEVVYMREAEAEAWEWIRSHPGEFLWLTARRAANLWLGPIHRPRDMIPFSALTLLAVLGAWLGWTRLSVPQRAAIIIPLVAYPLVYYIVVYMPRYRSPIDWILFALAGTLVGGWLEWELVT